MKRFHKRTYDSIGELVREFVWPFRHRQQLRQAMRGELISPAFRERLMLAVTAVNDCRYCSYFHAREAVKAGIPAAETRRLLDGNLELAPAEELPALLYAQHWAEANAQPDPAARQKLAASYGPEKAAAIETVLRMIRVGNLLGNTGDRLLYTLSFGRLGSGG